MMGALAAPGIGLGDRSCHLHAGRVLSGLSRNKNDGHPWRRCRTEGGLRTTFLNSALNPKTTTFIVSLFRQAVLAHRC